MPLEKQLEKEPQERKTSKKKKKSTGPTDPILDPVPTHGHDHSPHNDSPSRSADVNPTTPSVNSHASPPSSSSSSSSSAAFSSPTTLFPTSLSVSSSVTSSAFSLALSTSGYEKDTDDGGVGGDARQHPDPDPTSIFFLTSSMGKKERDERRERNYEDESSSSSSEGQQSPSKSIKGKASRKASSPGTSPSRRPTSLAEEFGFGGKMAPDALAFVRDNLLPLAVRGAATAARRRNKDAKQTFLCNSLSVQQMKLNDSSKASHGYKCTSMSPHLYCSVAKSQGPVYLTTSKQQPQTQAVPLIQSPRRASYPALSGRPQYQYLGGALSACSFDTRHRCTKLVNSTVVPVLKPARGKAKSSWQPFWEQCYGLKQKPQQGIPFRQSSSSAENLCRQSHSKKLDPLRSISIKGEKIRRKSLPELCGMKSGGGSGLYYYSSSRNPSSDKYDFVNRHSMVVNKSEKGMPRIGLQEHGRRVTGKQSQHPDLLDLPHEVDQVPVSRAFSPSSIKTTPPSSFVPCCAGPCCVNPHENYYKNRHLTHGRADSGTKPTESTHSTKKETSDHGNRKQYTGARPDLASSPSSRPRRLSPKSFDGRTPNLEDVAHSIPASAWKPDESGNNQDKSEIGHVLLTETRQDNFGWSWKHQKHQPDGCQECAEGTSDAVCSQLEGKKHLFRMPPTPELTASSDELSEFSISESGQFLQTSFNPSCRNSQRSQSCPPTSTSCRETANNSEDAETSSDLTSREKSFKHGDNYTEMVKESRLYNKTRHVNNPSTSLFTGGANKTANRKTQRYYSGHPHQHQRQGQAAPRFSLSKAEHEHTAKKTGQQTSDVRIPKPKHTTKKERGHHHDQKSDSDSTEEDIMKGLSDEYIRFLEQYGCRVRIKHAQSKAKIKPAETKQQDKKGEKDTGNVKTSNATTSNAETSNVKTINAETSNTKTINAETGGSGTEQYNGPYNSEVEQEQWKNPLTSAIMVDYCQKAQTLGGQPLSESMVKAMLSRNHNYDRFSRTSDSVHRRSKKDKK